MIGPYQPREPLGVGGNGVVVRAIDVRDGRVVALKLRALRYRAQLDREYDVLRALAAASVVDAYEIGATPEHAYLALEYVECARRCDLDAVDQLRAALAHVHACGWVHGDVQPANVLVGDDRHVKLCDFGAAGRIGAAGVAAGVPRYASPARLAGAPLSPADDLHSLDVMVCELTRWR